MAWPAGSNNSGTLLGVSCKAVFQELVELGVSCFQREFISELTAQWARGQTTQVAHPWVTYPSLQPSFA